MNMNDLKALEKNEKKNEIISDNSALRKWSLA